jgi:hypothetical protein
MYNVLLFDIYFSFFFLIEQVFRNNSIFLYIIVVHSKTTIVLQIYESKSVT